MMTKEEYGPMESQELGAEDSVWGKALDTWDLIFLTVKRHGKVCFATSEEKGMMLLVKNCFEK
jgi:hypothetical protein